MFEGDTSLHRGRPQFPSTRWSLLIEGTIAEGRVPRSYLDDLARLYWRPVYAYVRRQWSRSNEDAKDLTQEFFAWVVESGFVSRADPDRGSFRGFLKVSLEHFLSDAERHRRRLKRGGARIIESMDEGLDRVDVPDAGQRTPGELLDEVWRREVLARVVDGLEDGYRCEGRRVYFDVFRDYFLDDAEVTYADLATKYGLDQNKVSNCLQHAKRRYRDVLRQTLADTVETEAALDAELAWFTGDGG